jgi:uncharacterized membrane protein YedE/YeeE
MIAAVWSFACGLVFSVGLCLSGMTRPSKVLGFLDVTGAWDPSLLVVMATGLALLVPAWRWLARREAPLLGGPLPGPPAHALDARLVGGAALFGVGWGLGGYCPGPALVGLASGMRAPLVFCAAMAAGMYACQFADAWMGRSDAAQLGAPPECS